MGYSSNFYKLARIIRDIEVLLSGNPKKIMNRIINKILGRMLYRRMWMRTGRKSNKEQM